MFRPAAVTRTSPRRPEKRSSPESSCVARSPVASHSLRARLDAAVGPRRAGDDVAAHHDLALGADADLAAGKRLAQRSAAYMEGMVEGDERGGLGHPITLDDRVAKSSPEQLKLRWQRRTARDQRPELPARKAVNAAEAHEPLVDRPAFGGGELRAEIGEE